MGVFFFGAGFFAEDFVVEPEGGEGFLGGAAFLLGQGEEQAVGSESSVVVSVGFVDGGGDGLLEVRRAGESAKNEGFFPGGGIAGFDELSEVGEIDAVIAEDLGAEAIGVVEDGQEDMLGADVFELFFVGEFLGGREDIASFFG